MSIPLPKVAYQEELESIRGFLEMQPPQGNLKPFPEHHCMDATRFVHKILGLEERAGWYVPKGRYSSQTKKWHSWNFDPELGLYIDLTMDQFDDTTTPITILPEKTRKLRANKRSTRFMHDHEMPQIEVLAQTYAPIT